MHTKFVAFLLAFAASATAGSLRTRDGKFLEGAVQLDPPGGVKITLLTGEQQKFPLAGVESAVFTSGAASSLPPEVAALMKGRGNGLLGTYYERVDLSGRAVHRLDESVNFDWELGEPIAGVQKDYFSARWAGQLEAPVSGKFTFHLDADDGARLWLADRLICDAWRVADGTALSGDIELQQGQRYDLRLEYYDNLGPARVRLSWTGPGIPKSIVPRNQLHAAIGSKPADTPATRGLLAAYYRRTELDSSSAVTRIDPQLDFTWGERAPVSEVPAEAFSARWSGQVAAQFTESYTFHVESGGGVKLWLDGQLILNQWNDRPGEFYSTVVPLPAGQKYDLRLEHFNTSKDAKLRLLWSSASQRKSPIPADALTPSRPAESGARKPQHGLLGTYFSRPDCSGEVLKRLDAQVNFDWADKPAAPGVPTEDFSVRWNGQVQAQHTENYTFHVEADDGVRVWLGDRQIIDEWRQQSTTVVSQPVALNAGQFYPLSIEYFSAKPPAMAKLKWSSPSTPLGVIPASRLHPPNAPSAPAPGERRLGLDRGVVTWDGSFLAAPLVSADDTALQFGGAQKDFSLSTVNASRIVFQSLSAQRAAKIESGRAGVLLVNGDFVDGEFKGLDRGRVKLSSVLFGLKFFDATYEVIAVILRDPAPGAPAFRVKASDGSVLLVKKFAIAADGLTVEDATLRGYKVPAQDLVEIRQGTGTNLFSAALRLGPQSIHAELVKVDAAAEREWKAKADAVRNLVLAENDKRARMDDEEQRKIRTELDAVQDAERSVKSVLAKLTEQQDALTRVRTELKTAEATADTARAEAKKVTAAYDAKLAETEKLKAQHDQGKALLAQRGQEVLAATRTRDTTQTKLNIEAAAAENQLSSARNRLAAVKQDEANRTRSAEANRKAAAVNTEQAESARTKQEATWKQTTADLQKAATARDEAKKAESAAKQSLDKLTAAHTELARKAAGDKSITAAQVAEAKTAADKANADFAAKTRAAEEARVKRDRLQSEEAAKKRDLDRLTVDATVKSTTLKTAQAAQEKVERETKAARLQAEEQVKAAEQKLTEAKATKEKQLAELNAKLAEAEKARKQVEQETTDLGNTVQKLARERDQLKVQAGVATGVADRAATDVALRKRTVQTAETQVTQQLERKLAAEKQLADAKSTIEKRARAQFK
ncbi:MAG: PA14 domain-containing protein [Limisphaerales bacterium]